MENSKSGRGNDDKVQPRTPERESDDTRDSSPRADQGSNLQKDPDEWTTGSESMTDAQRSYLKTLSDEAGEETNEDLTKAEASKRIDELQHKTGRGVSH